MDRRVEGRTARTALIAARRILAAGSLLLAAAPAAAQTPVVPDSTGGWIAVAWGQEGTASGWVRVRENAIRGTRLELPRDLGVRRMAGWGLEVVHPSGSHSAIDLMLASYSFSGRATPSAPVLFNGATLQAGAPLLTRVGFPDFLRVRFLYRRRVARPGGGARLGIHVGADLTLLTFRMHGTLDPSTVGRETKEDFLSQELPVPLAGLDLTAPLARRLDLVASLTGGFLPRVPSLRKEGGEVRLRQDEEEVEGGVRWRVGRRLLVQGLAFWSGFGQDERSAEDGNQVRIDSAGLRLTGGVLW